MWNRLPFSAVTGAQHSGQVDVPCTAHQGEFRIVPEKEACRDLEYAQTSRVLDCIQAGNKHYWC